MTAGAALAAADPVYVAGHRGLIGSAVCRRLRAEGFRNVLTRSRAELDLADARAVDAFFKEARPRHVVLAAGLAGGILKNKEFPADFITANLAVQLNVIRAAQAAGVERLVFFGSSCMYPRECPQPMKEEQLLTGPLEPTSRAYALAKLAGVEMCEAYNRQYGGKRFLPVIPNSVYGPGDDFRPDSSHVLSALLRRLHEARESGADAVTLWGTGTPRREFVYCDDVAEACLLILRADLASVEFPLNIGGGGEYSVLELAGKIRETVKYGGRLAWDRTRPDGAPRKALDGARLSRLGWKPRTGLDEGLRLTYEWLLKNPDEARA